MRRPTTRITQIALALLFSFPLASAGGPGGVASAAAPAVGAPFFIANVGQWEGNFQFKCEVGSTVYFITPQGMTVDFREFRRIPPQSSGGARGGKTPNNPDPFERDHDSITVRGHVVQIHYYGLPPNSSANSGGIRGASGENKLPHYSNYFLGRDSTQWRSRVGHYQSIIVPEVWPGVDIEYRADKLGVETVYHVKPGADPAQIQMEYLGLDAPLRVDAQGNLVLTTSLGDMKEKAPFAFQQDGNVQKKIDSYLQLNGNDRIRFILGTFNSNKFLTIDPLLYSTYLGGGDVDGCNVVCSAPDGGVYVAGSTYALSGFPTTAGAYDETGLYSGSRLFCCHFGPNGEFIASTLFGGIQTPDNPNTIGGIGAMIYDSVRSGLWVAGYTGGGGWPLTPDAIDSIIDEHGDAFLLSFSADLETLQYCTYLGGDNNDAIGGLALDTDGRIVAAGETYSTDFPVTPDAFYSVRQEYDLFLWMYDPDAGEVGFSTYFGGSSPEYGLQAIEFDPIGRAWFIAQTVSPDLPVTASAFQSEIGDSSIGWGDMLLAGITFTPPTIEYCSYIGGVDIDVSEALAFQDSFVYFAGKTASHDFPVSTNAYDTLNSIGLTGKAVIARINWLTNEYAGTFFGGEGYERIVHNTNWVHDSTITLLGETTSSDLPVMGDAYQAVLRGSSDGFVVKFNRTLTNLLYCSYIGGGAGDDYSAAITHSADSLWLVGNTLSIDFPTTPDAIQPGDNALTSGFVQYFAIDTTADTTSATEQRPLPSDFELIAFPNPFNPTTTLSFTLPRSTAVEITIHNVLGQQVARMDMGPMPAGNHQHQIGNPDWPSGLYFASLKTTSATQVTKLVLLR